MEIILLIVFIGLIKLIQWILILQREIMTKHSDVSVLPIAQLKRLHIKKIEIFGVNGFF